MTKNKPKSDWQIVKFGDVVKQIKDRVDRDKVGLKYYLGGEHFSNGELHVNGKGQIDGSSIGPAFHMRFKPGQMLLVSRNPHLRKAAIAEFEGICANTTYICEAISDHLIPEFLPFIMQSDIFWDSASMNKRGSTNPYLNWGDFARFEFSLPSKDEQKRIADILWEVDRIEQLYTNALKELSVLRTSHFAEKCFLNFSQNSLRNNTQVPNGWEVFSLKDCMHEIREKSTFPHKHEIYLGLEHLPSGGFSIDKFDNSRNYKSTCSVFRKGDLLYGKLRPNLDKAIIAQIDGVCSTELLVFRSKKNTTNEYLIHLMHSRDFVNYNIHNTFGTKMPRTSMNIIGKYLLPLPNLASSR